MVSAAFSLEMRLVLTTIWVRQYYPSNGHTHVHEHACASIYTYTRTFTT